MRVVVVCEKCGARREAHRLGTGFEMSVDHTCDTPENRPVFPPYEKGPIHIDRGRR